MASRRCSCCGKKKSVSLFHKDRCAADGFAASCKFCRNSKRKTRKMVQKEGIVEPVEPDEISISYSDTFGEENAPQALPKSNTAIHTVKIEPENGVALENVPHFMCLTFGHGKGVRLQIHGRNPELHIKGETVAEVLARAMDIFEGRA